MKIYRHGLMKYARNAILTLLCGIGLASLTMADDAAPPAAAPSTTAPATSQPTRVAHKMEVPPGFHLVQVAGRAVVCEPQDDTWVSAAAQAVPPATRPSTMPSDIEGFVKVRRGDVTAEMMRDLAMTDQKPIDDFFDGRLADSLQKMDAMKPGVYYLIATREKMADLMAAGWSDPRFHYIRFAHDVDYSTSVVLSATEPMDDLVWWIEIHPGDTIATRGDALQQEIKFSEGGMVNHISLMGKNECENLCQTFVHDQTIKSLKLPGTLEWFDFGVSHIYGIKYAAELTGMSREYWTEQLIGTPKHRGNWNRIDLLNPVDPAEVRPELQELYQRALMPKGALMIQTLIDRGGGDGVLAKVLPPLRAHTPTTPKEMAKTLLDATGVDLTGAMGAVYEDAPASAGG
jgi:hypothetical protein